MIDYHEHFQSVKSDLSKLLEARRKSNYKDERAVQKFIEKNPYCLISALDGIEANYSFFGNCIISQPKIKSYDGDRVPDFLIVTRNSLNLYFNFIEIEDPSKKIFKRKRQGLTSDFFQAYHQLKEWKSFSKNEISNYCEDLLNTLFKDNFNNTPEKHIHYNYVLIYGFSSEILELGPRYNDVLQDYFDHKNVKHSTFSRLINNLRFEQPFFTIKKDVQSNKFRAIGCTPFRKYGIDEWSEFHNIIGKEEIISESVFFTNEEKEKLKNQISNLDNKSRSEINEIVMGSDGISVTNLNDIDL